MSSQSSGTSSLESWDFQFCAMRWGWGGVRWGAAKPPFQILAMLENKMWSALSEMVCRMWQYMCLVAFNRSSMCILEGLGGGVKVP